ncbi:hypothetical protein TM4_64 [Mycobacterium phage TM4]|uniref:Uncharacterized protein n=1 Tax=Mycobacterium phage TM4 TaxID=88870 RepID=Q9ZX16_BPMT4|nr:hypothetical protein TM4_gp64 [Mycobacterium phage TM4]AAD17629.1 hypothetical protein TM4_64 [Mycobacterium phage TM4]AGK85697.1 hypothetical protein 33D_0015 [Mycobacterium phage 33D]
MSLDPVSRMAWEQQLAIAKATQRVQQRQIGLLTTQREIIDDQLADAVRKRNEASGLIAQALGMLNAQQ